MFQSVDKMVKYIFGFVERNDSSVLDNNNLEGMLHSYFAAHQDSWGYDRQRLATSFGDREHKEGTRSELGNRIFERLVKYAE